MKMNSILKWVIAATLLVVLGFFGFTAEVREGEYAVITRFGAVRSEVTESGLYFKLPWPFENVVKYDSRNQYTESPFLETLTKDKRNIILQSFAVWSIEDPLKYHTSVGDTAVAEQYINDLIINATNGIMGNYNLSNVVSTDAEELKVDEIKSSIFERVKEHALNQYGIEVSEVSVMKISLPEENLNSVFDQMTADRQKFIDQIIAEGQRLASEIMYEAEAEAARIMAEGTAEAAKINAETEKKIAEIYASAQAANLELYKFLTQLDALSNSITENSTMIVKKDQYPFDILNGLPADLAQKIEDAIKENNKIEEGSTEENKSTETTDGGTGNG